MNNYASSPGDALITNTALGVLLLIFAALLAYSGVLHISTLQKHAFISYVLHTEIQIAITFSVCVWLIIWSFCLCVFHRLTFCLSFIESNWEMKTLFCFHLVNSLTNTTVYCLKYYKCSTCRLEAQLFADWFLRKAVLNISLRTCWPTVIDLSCKPIAKSYTLPIWATLNMGLNVLGLGRGYLFIWLIGANGSFSRVFFLLYINFTFKLFLCSLTLNT